MKHTVRGKTFGVGNDLRAGGVTDVTVKACSDVADQTLRERFVGLGGKKSEREIEKIARGKISFADGIPE
jgi:hypothetical protein